MAAPSDHNGLPSTKLDRAQENPSAAQETADHSELFFLASPPSSATESLASPSRSEEAGNLPTAPGYELLEELGRGGMGVVFKARQIALDRLVALKMIRRGHGATSEDIERFRREAQIAATLDHPHIVPIYETGGSPEEPFFSMKLLPGGTLTMHKGEFRGQSRKAAQWLAKVAQAVHHAHQRGLMHRDLKPGNILLDEAGEPLVGDFGLAKHIEGDAALTRTGAIVGTPSYMAPEQAAGATVLTTAADIYSLGAILFEMLTGRPPHVGASAVDVLFKVRTEEPIRLRRLDRKIPHDLETVCLKCLSRDPARRYGSAEALAQDLDDFAAGKPIAARPTGLVESTWKWVRRRPLVAALLAAVVLVAAIGLGAFTWAFGETLTARNTAEKTLRDLQTTQEAADYKHASDLVRRLLDANINLVPLIVTDIDDIRPMADPLLRDAAEKAKDPSQKLRLSLALLPVDAGQVKYLYVRLLEAEPHEVSVIRDALAPHQEELREALWAAALEVGESTQGKRLRAAAALAKYEAASARWARIQDTVADDLVRVPPIYLAPWLDALRPVAGPLEAPLAVIFRDERRHPTERAMATDILAEYDAQKLALLTDLILDAEPKQFITLFPILARHGERALDRLRSELDKKPPPTTPDKEIFKKEASIGPDDPKFKLPSGRSLPAKMFEVTLQAGKFYRIAMASKEIDSLLILQDSSGTQLAYDDDSGGNLDSLLEFRPPYTGSYKVFTAALPNLQTKAMGRFVLTITEAPGQGAPHRALDSRQANAAVALLRMNQAERVWPLLKHSPDPTLRSWLIHRLGPLGVDSDAIVQALATEPDISIRRALILSLGPGEFPRSAWTAQDKKRMVDELQVMYRSADDPGLHAASEWLLRAWQYDDWLRQTNDAWAKDKEGRGKRLEQIRQQASQPALAVGEKVAEAPGAKAARLAMWYVNSQGQTMVVIRGPVEFLMGSPSTEEGRQPVELQHRKRIGRSFAIAAGPVTKEQMLRFQPRFGHDEMRRYPEPSCPIGGVTWLEAAAYCNWLSKEEGIPETEWCYETNAKGEVTKLKENSLSLTGYRLPTEAEWEYACRAGAATSRYYGEPDDLLEKYAWYFKNATERTWPVGSRKPNDFGLFDMHGNLLNWCQDKYKAYPQGEKDKTLDDSEDLPLAINAQESRALRGAAFSNHAPDVRAGQRSRDFPTYRYSPVGLRPARTISVGQGHEPR